MTLLFMVDAIGHLTVPVASGCKHTFYLFKDHVNSILTCGVESYSRRGRNLGQGLRQRIGMNFI